MVRYKDVIRTRNASLNTQLSPLLGRELRIKVQHVIDIMVQKASIASHHGAIRANYTVLYNYDNNLDPFAVKQGTNSSVAIRHMFKPTHRIASTHIPAVVLANTNNLLPNVWDREIEFIVDGMAEVYTKMADKYATHIENHVNGNWKTYLKRAIEAYLLTYGEDRDHPLFDILFEVITDSQWTTFGAQITCNYPSMHFDNDDMKFISKMIRFYQDYTTDGTNFLMDEDFVARNTKIMPYFFVRLLRYIEKVADDHDVFVERFNCLPMHSIDRKSIPIQGRALYYIVKKAVFDGGQVYRFANRTGATYNKSQFGSNTDNVRDYYWNLLFNIQKYTNPSNNLRHNSSEGAISNGVKCGLLYKKRVVDTGDDDEADTEKKMPKRKLLPGKSPSPPLDPQVVQGETVAIDDEAMDDLLKKTQCPIEIDGVSKYHHGVYVCLFLLYLMILYLSISFKHTKQLIQQ